MKFKKLLLAGIASLTVFTSSVIPCFAANDTNQTANTDGDLPCIVSAEVSSTYSVCLPATLTLAYDPSSQLYKNTYTVGAKGIITNTQYVSIIPDASFTMTGQTGGATATAGVTQTVTKWVNRTPGSGEMAINVTSYAESTGNISVDLPKQVDNYNGSFTFTYCLVTE